MLSAGDGTLNRRRRSGPSESDLSRFDLRAFAVSLTQQLSHQLRRHHDCQVNVSGGCGWLCAKQVEWKAGCAKSIRVPFRPRLIRADRQSRRSRRDARVVSSLRPPRLLVLALAARRRVGYVRQHEASQHDRPDEADGEVQHVHPHRARGAVLAAGAEDRAHLPPRTDAAVSHPATAKPSSKGRS